MSIIVQKFGGTSVADIEKIRNVADRVEEELQLGNKLVVVLSAMAGVTDKLVGYAKESSSLLKEENFREYDVIVSTGEQVTVGILALILQERGVKAKSYLGWQVPIKTEGRHNKARVNEVYIDKIQEGLKRDEVVIIPGFQGVDYITNEITTLGRGGSDTTAVALAAKLKASRCDIYTDVDGVYTSDPRIVKDARKLNKIAYEEMLEMASLGAKVLQTRCVELAMNYNVNLQVRSTFSKNKGTLLVNEEEIMEKRIITGIAHSKNEAQITLVDVDNVPGVAAKCFATLANIEINVDMIVQNISVSGNNLTDLTFTVPLDDAEKAKIAITNSDLKCKSLLINDNVVKISVIGVGMKANSGIASKMFETLANIGVNILVISTSEVKISVLIEQQYLELAMRELHLAFSLDNSFEKK